MVNVQYFGWQPIFAKIEFSVLNTLCFMKSDPGWLSGFFSCLWPLWPQVQIPPQTGALYSVCGLSFQSLPDCMFFPLWGFPPAAKTEYFFLFPIHPAIASNNAGICSIRLKQTLKAVDTIGNYSKCFLFFQLTWLQAKESYWYYQTLWETAPSEVT